MIWIPLAALVCGVISVASWSFADPANHFFHEVSGGLSLVFFGAYLCLALAYVALSRQSRIGAVWALWCFAAMAIPLAAAFPVSSRDVFLYSFYGKMWLSARVVDHAIE